MVVNPVSDFLKRYPDRFAKAIKANLKETDDISDFVFLNVLNLSKDTSIPEFLADFAKKESGAEMFHERLYRILGEKGGKKSVAFLILELKEPGKQNKISILNSSILLHNRGEIETESFMQLLDEVSGNSVLYDDATRQEAMKIKAYSSNNNTPSSGK